MFHKLKIKKLMQDLLETLIGGIRELSLMSKIKGNVGHAGLLQLQQLMNLIKSKKEDYQDQ